MDDRLLTFLEKLLTVALSSVIYVYLVGFLLPRFTMRVTARFPSRSSYGEGDRGVRQVVFSGGRATVYEPSSRMRPWMPRYALIKQDGCTFIKCQLHEKATRVRYDVVAYDRHGRLLDVVGVRELVTERGCTKTVRLPRDTAYARVILRKMDGMYEDHSPLLGYRLAGMAILCGGAACATWAWGLLCYNGLTVMADILGLKCALSLGGYCLILFPVGLGVALWMMLMYGVRRGKVLNA